MTQLKLRVRKTSVSSRNSVVDSLIGLVGLPPHDRCLAVSDVRGDFAKFLAAQGDRGDLSAEDREALFQQFLEWQKRQGH